MAIKKYDHCVIYDGKFYNAGQEIIIPDKEAEEEPAKKRRTRKAANNNADRCSN